ncbi:hypothetical protein FY528_15065 [Hymenobacter lutimineralis]|uniref:Glutaminyl-tRNA synthetase n=1 Tax=Hymenobacter lutimineralis TaxID=2606448 RepID=A0A5D6UYG2_9BACT|nr:MULTISPECIES: DUF6370 family protein [Hymenobacter]QIX60503.1 hypothetical protein HER32_04600 [Hymenobacter sp. BT18]TYZ07384.1 hypothetical protein FY528_15065 [Hymenobacter lutimineralis]
MKLLLLFALMAFATLANAQAQKAASATVAAAPDKAKPVQVVEAACGQCRLGLPGKSCDLAVRIQGQAYFVDGTGIDSHGDAHAQDGLCNAVRRAEVQGEVVNNRFVATYFRLLPEAGKGQ